MKTRRRKVGEVWMWTENDLIYIQTADGKITGLSAEQAICMGEDMKKMARKAKPGEKVMVDWRKYGRMDGTP